MWPHLYQKGAPMRKPKRLRDANLRDVARPPRLYEASASEHVALLLFVQVGSRKAGLTG